jgi:uncharacterized protein (DUF1684 family)
MIALIIAAVLAGPVNDFQADTMAWRKAREESLLRPNGWLAVSGLFWLKAGSQSLGSSRRSDIHLPDSAPVNVGTVLFEKGVVTIKALDGVEVLVNGKPSNDPIKSDADGRPDKVQIADLTLNVIKRGKRIGLRLWDPNSKARKNFEGCKWFAPDPALVVRAKFVPHVPARTIPILNVLGDTEPSPNPGYVEFVLKGRKYRLEAIEEGNELFFNFKDQTSGHETYPAGRFLNTEGPKNGFVTLDFNRAVNPPCAFTAFATCPLPPKGNTLKVKILAGELSHHPLE